MPLRLGHEVLLAKGGQFCRRKLRHRQRERPTGTFIGDRLGDHTDIRELARAIHQAVTGEDLLQERRARSRQIPV